MFSALFDVLDKTFDYIIVGGGTSGLVLANRLSADPFTSVLVLEAGGHHANDLNLLVPTLHGAQLLNPEYDWGFKTTEQKNLNDTTTTWNRGKGLGGTSGINFHGWTTPPAQDIDALEKLGNPGWNWNEYSRYFRRCETYHPDPGQTYKPGSLPKTRGTSGPIHTMTPPTHPFSHLVQSTHINMGLKMARDPYSGDITGICNMQSNVDPKTMARSYAANGYYFPIKHRSNLKVLTGASVSRVILERRTNHSDFTATGAEFSHRGKTHIVNCGKELILSAGTVKDPQILELSGIGRRDVLDKIGVTVKIELPGVGENLQDHLHFLTVFQMDPKIPCKTLDLMQDPVHAKRAMRSYVDDKKAPSEFFSSWTYFQLSFASPDGSERMIQDLEDKITELERNKLLPPGLIEQYKIQLQSLRDPRVPDCQHTAFPGHGGNLGGPLPPGETYVSVLSLINHPFSRGAIHASSKDPTVPPEIDPRYFEFDYDLDLLVKSFLVSRRMLEHEPFKSGITREVLPGPEADTEDKIRDYIKSSISAGYHAIGTCSMLPRDKNGVVSPDLLVYGTTNLRVVDLSIMPIHFASHAQTTGYVIGEKAADIIRGLNAPSIPAPRY